jgi:hypothetical protein
MLSRLLRALQFHIGCHLRAFLKADVAARKLYPLVEGKMV